MGLEVYYPTDIRNALLAAEQAANATAKAVRPAHDGAIGNQDDPFSAGFLAGYWAALTTLALAFGLGPQRQPLVDAPAWHPVNEDSLGLAEILK